MAQGSITLSGTVSHGTLRTADLLYRLADELDRVSADDRNLTSEARQNAAILNMSVTGRARNEDIAADVLADLFRRLDEIANEHGMTFGAHPGDGSDFGYWPPESD